MILESANSGVNFKGIIHEDKGKGGFPESGKIEGLVMDNKLSFLKKMPQAYALDQYDLPVPFFDKYSAFQGATGTWWVERLD